MNDPNSSLLFMMNRLGYGPSLADMADLRRPDPNGWLEEQLAPPPGDDSDTAKRLSAVTMQIKYNADDKGRWPAVDEMRPLSALNAPIEQLWPLLDGKNPQLQPERGRPRDEVIAATLLRSVYSKYQLREIMAQFWHDHFHVNAYAGDQIAVGLPAYDRDVIRKNCLGNFRSMIEDVACSTSMQYYLSNHSSRAGAANENYGRELFELHTLGAESYFNDKYNRWRDVPGALQGHPTGYIDEDVYESARAFTGWTIEDGGHVDGQRVLPATGKFIYVEKWHDGYQKRVLAAEFQPFTPPMADGREVLDLVSAHPATARHVTGKLCQRLVGPTASPALKQQAAEAWLKLAKAPDQIARVAALIIRSPDFAASQGQKVKRPLALMAGFVRGTGMDFMPTIGLSNQIASAGQKLFGHPTPAGLPDTNAFYTGSNAMRQRWQLLLGLSHNSWNNGTVAASSALEAWGFKAATTDQAVASYLRLFGGAPSDKLVTATMDGAGFAAFSPLGNDSADKQLAMAAAIAAMTPAFQVS
jgi:uncharacterized protein (DUF1800 family)